MSRSGLQHASVTPAGGEGREKQTESFGLERGLNTQFPVGSPSPLRAKATGNDRHRMCRMRAHPKAKKIRRARRAKTNKLPISFYFAQPRKTVGSPPGEHEW